jgi:GNAT superfamily N-acetyltransferase
VEYSVLGWPPEAPRLRLDWRRFAYAGKFVTGRTGAAVARDPDGSTPDPSTPATSDRDGSGAVPDLATDVVAAASFSEDRTDPDCLRVRYVTVREDRRGEGVGPRLLSLVAARAADRGYRTVRIAVNNPFAYEAAYRAGFAFTGAETGLAELVCDWPAPDGHRSPDADCYREGLGRFRDRDPEAATRAFLRDRHGADPPRRVPVPDGAPADDGPGG